MHNCLWPNIILWVRDLFYNRVPSMYHILCLTAAIILELKLDHAIIIACCIGSS